MSAALIWLGYKEILHLRLCLRLLLLARLAGVLSKVSDCGGAFASCCLLGMLWSFLKFPTPGPLYSRPPHAQSYPRDKYYFAGLALEKCGSTKHDTNENAVIVLRISSETYAFHTTWQSKPLPNSAKICVSRNSPINKNFFELHKVKNLALDKATSDYWLLRYVIVGYGNFLI